VALQVLGLRRQERKELVLEWEAQLSGLVRAQGPEPVLEPRELALVLQELVLQELVLQELVLQELVLQEPVLRELALVLRELALVLGRLRQELVPKVQDLHRLGQVPELELELEQRRQL